MNLHLGNERYGQSKNVVVLLSLRAFALTKGCLKMR